MDSVVKNKKPSSRPSVLFPCEFRKGSQFVKVDFSNPKNSVSYNARASSYELISFNTLFFSYVYLYYKSDPSKFTEKLNALWPKKINIYSNFSQQKPLV